MITSKMIFCVYFNYFLILVRTIFKSFKSIAIKYKKKNKIKNYINLYIYHKSMC